MKKIAVLLLSILLSAGMSCQTGQNSQSESKDNRLKVVATTGMIADMIKNIGGDRIEVKGLMGPGIDPHLYKATAGDISDMSEADLIVYNGLHLEGKMSELFEKMSARKKTIAVSGGLSEEDLISGQGMSGQHDPHIWFDVTLWSKAAAYMTEQLSHLDPEHKDIYQKNGQAYLSKLEELNTYVESVINRIPEENRVLVTAHDAFHYFGRAYNIDVKGLQGISTASEAGTADVAALADMLAEKKIPAVFVESSVPTRYMDALKEAVKSRGHQVSIGGSLYSDAMGSEGSPEGTYIGMVKHNVETIMRALTGEVI